MVGGFPEEGLGRQRSVAGISGARRPSAATLAPDDISVAEEFVADLVALAETRDAVYYAPELVHLIHIVGLITCVTADPQQIKTLEDVYHRDGPQDFFRYNLTEIVKAVRIG